MKRRLALLLVVLSCGFPELVSPLVPPEKGVLDKALLATWVGDKKSEEIVLKISQKSGAVLSVVSPRESKDALMFEAHASELGGAKYLNARLFEDGAVASNWFIVKYELGKDGKLTLWTMADGPVRLALEKKELKGESKGSPAQRVITDTPEKVAAFIKKTKDLWEPFGTFTRQ